MPWLYLVPTLLFNVVVILVPAHNISSLAINVLYHLNSVDCCFGFLVLQLRSIP